MPAVTVRSSPKGLPIATTVSPGIRSDRCDPAFSALLIALNSLLRKAIRQIEEYFAGKRRRFDLPMAPAASPFQEKVRHQCCLEPEGLNTHEVYINGMSTSLPM